MQSNRLRIFGEASADQDNKPFVVSVISGKGGVGKSTVIYNLATVMAQAGSDCLVIDADWYFGNQHILGNFVPRLTLSDVIENHDYSQEAIIAVQPHLFFIASPSVSGEEIEFNDAKFARFLAEMRELYASFDFIFIDTPSGMVNLLNLAANASDINLIVLNPELTSISDAYGLFKYLTRSNRKIPVHLLLNRVQNNSEASFIYQKLSALSERFLGHYPNNAGYLLEDKAIIEAVARQKSLFEMDPNGPAMERFLYLCNLLWKEKTGVDRFEETKQAAKINTPMVLADIKEE